MVFITNYIRQKNEKGESILHVAASSGQMEVVQWLSIHLSDLDEETPTGYTAIHQAAMQGHTQVMMVSSNQTVYMYMKVADGCKV